MRTLLLVTIFAAFFVATFADNAPQPTQHQGKFQKKLIFSLLKFF